MKSAFQPIVSASGALFGYEALLRIYCQDGLLLQTEPFFSTGFMPSSDRINLDRLARVIHLRNFARFVSDGALFLNMTPIAALDAGSQQYGYNSLISRVKELGLSNDRIYFEILEHTCANDRLLVSSLQDMQDYGFRIAIDDYGVDASSESRVRKVNPDIIKVDRSLLTDYMDGKPEELQAVISLAHELNAKVLTEGIESQNDFNTVRELGVDYMQGYYIGRPVLVSELPCLFEPII
ncbi:hypothetical protein BIT28_20095 [Photobacterium proteolyticum]|uniref:EAL domain-containing protein n=1 Tax=Photobacterium proteolyticum TaxID=1903952 RepID=A0A1Q9GI63_9GAMM|nr:EAL domain-containing protein [Photobacterium proteolyticum]OLQ74174.1 hypothetical protein BIT28_20095 [Photobacterium proteolyticum]